MKENTFNFIAATLTDSINRNVKPSTHEINNDNKIEKSMRNVLLLDLAIEKAQQGMADLDIDNVTNLDLLKVFELFSIREIFSIEDGECYYQLYKEVFYIDNPHKYYAETVMDENPTVYRRVAKQHEKGDIDWAKAVAKEYGLDIYDRDNTLMTKVEVKKGKKIDICK